MKRRLSAAIISKGQKFKNRKGAVLQRRPASFVTKKREGLIVVKEK